MLKFGSVKAGLVGGIAALLLAIGAWQWHDDRTTRFLPQDTSAFVTRFAAPPTVDSTASRAEVEELLSLQNGRSAEDIAAARADRRTRVSQFYAALGLVPQRAPALPRVSRLAQRVEDDVRLYVRAVKNHFRRLRPYEIDSRIQPCIDDVQGDLSYPSGHAAFGWAMADMLSDLVPERSTELARRADEFARQRMVCGVHFRSDIEAGKQAAAWLLEAMRRDPRYREEAASAATELRSALGLGPAPLASPSN